MKNPKASVLIATRNRAPALEKTLAHIFRQQCLDHTAFEVIVVDNGSTGGTGHVLERLKNMGPLVTLNEPAGGKSSALNAALAVARGELLVFTDDDVVPSPRWLSELLRAATGYPAYGVFCGPIVPDLPDDCPVWLRDHPVMAPLAFATFCPQEEEAELRGPMLPFGPNFAVRASAARGEWFRTDLGPSSNGYFFCEDTEYVARFRRRGEAILFVPAARVTHCVDPDRITPVELWERGFRFGRSVIRVDGMLRVCPPAVFTASSDPEIRRIEAGMVLSFYSGQLAELASAGSTTKLRELIGEISKVDWSGTLDDISTSAAHWLSSQPELLSQIALARAARA